MESTRVERREQLMIEVGRWSASVTSVAVTIVFVLVVGMLANGLRTNHARAEDWRRRAVANEEIVGGLRTVIAERSRALNQRTAEANQLAASLDSKGAALRRTRVSVGSLARRQSELAKQYALADAALRKLQQRQTELVSAASALDACAQSLEAVVAAAQSGKPKPKPADLQARLAQCGKAHARLGAYQRSG